MAGGRLKLPPQFQRNVRHYFPGGDAWLRALPGQLSALARGWGLELGPPFELSVNYVCAVRWQGQPAVLKLSPSPGELAREVDALRAYRAAGLPCPEVLRYDAAAGAYLMTRLSGPSQWHSAELSAEADAAQAEQAAALLARLRGIRPMNAEAFPLLETVLTALHKLQPTIPPALLERARELARELSSGQPTQLLHGDLHHGNLLWHGQTLHLTDPHGYWGPYGFEVGAWLRNPAPHVAARPDLPALLTRRVAILAEHTGLSAEEVRGWGCIQATLSACWDAGDGDAPAPALTVAQALA